MAVSEQLKRVLRVALCDAVSADELEALVIKIEALIAPALINAAINADGSIAPQIVVAASALPSSIYIDSVSGKAVFQDAAGVDHDLY